MINHIDDVLGAEEQKMKDEAKAAAEKPHGFDIRRPSDKSTSDPANIIILPSDCGLAEGATLTGSADAIFGKMAELAQFYNKGGKMIELIDKDGALEVDFVTVDAFPSRLELLGNTMAWKVGRNGDDVVLAPKICSSELAKKLMETRAVNKLDNLSLMVDAPILTKMDDGPKMLERG